MKISAKTVKDLRERTGAGMMDCKKALVKSDGDLDKAVDFLRKSGIAKAEKKGSRTASEGIIYSYIHHGDKLGVLLELNCETDFVAKTEGFNGLANNLAMQIAATNPISIDRDSIDKNFLKREESIFKEQALSSGKPENVVDKIVKGKLEKLYSEICLLDQLYIKDTDKKISDLLNEAIATLGENIVITRFIRFAVGENTSPS
ncbi:MAG: translation elongation factor Ts [bacterium TMED144]|nr:MAG: translation elongation factor Ts [bacterium TMED144]|tara:strand:- start:7246 stop:7854 length:609 start_codon:yes stop_codon:yes gene_type:complete